MKLDPITNPQMLKIHDAITSRGFSLRPVGGFVRDLILGEKPKDCDMCTDALPEKLVEIGKEAGFTVVPTGLQHGTVTFVVDHEPFEITTLRIDNDTDGRHAEVEYTTSFEQDAARRDLTMNAMSMDFDGTVYDYFGGIDDLKNNIVRFVGDTKTRIQEDYLRILRYFRFAARFSADMDWNDCDIISQHASLEGLKQISRERVWLEMQKLFIYPDRASVYHLMDNYGVAKAIGLPLDGLAKELNRSDDACSVVAQFFTGRPVEAREFCNSWKMSRAETNKIVWLADKYYVNLTLDRVMDWLVDGVSTEYIISLCAMTLRPDIAVFVEGYYVPVFPIRGQDIMDEYKIMAGPIVGQALADLRQQWKESRYTLTKIDLIGRAHHALSRLR